MNGPRLTKPAIEALREIRQSDDLGRPIRMYGGRGFWCSGVKQSTTTFKEILGHGFANVINARLTITDAGRAYIDGLP